MRAVAAREDIEDLILDAAERLLLRHGYRKMTMEELAHEVGIGKGTIYLHFKSKENLVLSQIDRIIYRLLVKLQMIAHGDGRAAERLRRMLLMRVMFRFDSVWHYAESVSDLLAAVRPALLARRARHFAEEARVFAAVLKDGQFGGEFSCTEPEVAARTLLIATNALLPYSLSSDELVERKDLEKEAARLADILLYGLIRGGDAVVGASDTGANAELG